MESLLSTYSKKVRRALIVAFLLSSILLFAIAAVAESDEMAVVFLGYLVLFWPFVFLFNWVRKADNK